MKTEEALRELIREKFGQLSKEELKRILDEIEKILKNKKPSKK